MVFSYLVTTGWIFGISSCDNSINQSKTYQMLLFKVIFCRYVCAELAPLPSGGRHLAVCALKISWMAAYVFGDVKARGRRVTTEGSPSCFFIMYVCMVITYSKGKVQPGNVANPVRGQLNRDYCFSLSPFAPENLVS